MLAFISPRAGARFIRGYYWATPAFLLLDVKFGLDLRIPFLSGMPGAKWLYYCLGFACALLVTFRPAWTFMVGYLESSLNIALLIVSFWATYVSVLESAGSADTLIANPFTPNAVASLIFSAIIFASSHILHADAVRRSRTLGA
jgi:hypothetical protein